MAIRIHKGETPRTSNRTRFTLQVFGDAKPDEPRAVILWAARRVDGRLRSRLYRVPVEIAIVCWSDDEAELGLHPLARPAAGSASWGPYLRYGARALDVLGRKVCDRHAARVRQKRSA